MHRAMTPPAGLGGRPPHSLSARRKFPEDTPQGIPGLFVSFQCGEKQKGDARPDFSAKFPQRAPKTGNFRRFCKCPITCNPERRSGG